MKNIALKKARKEKGLTQLQLAKMLGYKRGQSVCNWENGYVDPPLVVAKKLAEILEKNINDIFFADQVQESHTFLKPTGTERM